MFLLKILCYFGYHTWTEWEEKGRKNLLTNGGKPLYSLIYMKRTCKRCGLEENNTEFF